MMETESSVDPDLNLDIPENLTFVDHKEFKITSPDRECIRASRISPSEFSSSQALSADVEKSTSLQEPETSNASFDTNSNFIVSSHHEYVESKDQILTDQIVLSDISTSLDSERSVDRIERKVLIDETDKIVSPVKLVEDLFRFVGDQELVDGEENQQANYNNYSGRMAPLARLELDDDLDITVSSQCKLENVPASENINRNRDPDDLNNNLEVIATPQQSEAIVIEGSSEKPSELSGTVAEIGNNESWNGHADKENGQGDLSQGHVVEVKQQSQEDEKTGEVVVITETITEEVEKETVHVTEIEEVWEYVEDSNHGMVIRKKNVVSQKEADEVSLKTLRKSHITTERHKKYTDDETNLTAEVSTLDQTEIEEQEKSSVPASDVESQGIREGSEHINQSCGEQEITELSDSQAEIEVQEKSSITASDADSQGFRVEESEHKIQRCEEQEIPELPDSHAELELQENSSVTASSTENQGVREGEESEHKYQRCEEQEITKFSDSQAVIEVQEKSSITASNADSQGFRVEESEHKIQRCEEQEITELSDSQAVIEVQEKSSITASDADSQGIQVQESEHKNERCEEQEFTELSDVTAGLSLQENTILIDSQQNPATCESQYSNFQIEETQQLLGSVLVKEEKACEIVSVGAGPSSEMEYGQDRDIPGGENKVLESEEGNQKTVSPSSAEDSVAMAIEKEANLVIFNSSCITTEGYKKEIKHDMDTTSEVSVPEQDEIVIQEESSVTALESQGIEKVGESEQKRDEQEFAESEAKIEISLQANSTLVDNQKSPATYESQSDNFQIVEAQQLLLSTEIVKEEIIHEIITVESRLASEVVTDLKNDALTAEHKVLGSGAMNAEGNQISVFVSSAEDSWSSMDQQISVEHNIPASHDQSFEENQSIQLHHHPLLSSSDVSSQNQSEQKHVICLDGQIIQDNEKNEGIINCETNRNQTEMKSLQIERKYKAPVDCETTVVKLGGSLMDEKSYEDIYYDDKHYSLTLHGSWLRQRNGEWQLKTDVANVPFEGASNEKEIVEILTKHYNCSKKDFEEPISALVHDLGLTEFSNFITIQKHYKLLNCTISLELTDFGFQVGEVAVKMASPTEIPSALQIIDNMANDLGFQPLHVETI